MAGCQWCIDDLHFFALRNRWHALGTAVGLTIALALPAAAFEPKLTSGEIQNAEQAGIALARAHQGFPVASYAIFSTPNALTLEQGQGSVDAIAVSTPYQRVLYESYLAAFQGGVPSTEALRRAAEPFTLDFVVIAHSSGQDANEQQFLTRFSNPIVKIQGDGTRRAVSKTSFGPTIDFFNFENKKRVLRWIGYDTYRFDLHSMRGIVSIARLKGTFSISDPLGHRYAGRFDLSGLK